MNKQQSLKGKREGRTALKTINFCIEVISEYRTLAAQTGVLSASQPALCTINS